MLWRIPADTHEQRIGRMLPSGERQGRSIETLDRKPEESGDGRRDVDQAGRAPRRSRRAAAVVGHQERPRLVRPPAAMLSAADGYRLARLRGHPAPAGNAEG